MSAPPTTAVDADLELVPASPAAKVVSWTLMLLSGCVLLAIFNLIVALHAPPNLCRRPRCRKRMQTDRSKVPMTAAQPRLDYEIEAHLIERLTSRAVVDPAQGDGGLVVLAPK